MKINQSSTVSVFLKDCLNSRPKLIFFKQDTCSLFRIAGQTNQIISQQLLSLQNYLVDIRQKNFFKKSLPIPVGGPQCKALLRVPTGLMDLPIPVHPPLSGYGNETKQILTSRNYSAYKIAPLHRPSEQENFQLDPNWVTGFVDGEGCFTVTVREKKNFHLGWGVDPRFQISLHQKDEWVLEHTCKFFSVGSINKCGPQAGPFGACV